MKRISPALIAAALVLAVASTAHAATHRVPQDFATIQEAVTAAREGDKIVIDEGRYVESVVLATDDVTLLGKPGNEIVSPQGSGFAVLVSLSSGVRLKNLNVTSIVNVGISIDGCNGAVVQGCTVVGGTEAGIEVLASTGTKVQRNTVVNAVRGIAVGQEGSPGKASHGSKISKNSILGATTAAISADGTSNVVQRNKVTGGGVAIDAIGIRMTGQGGTIVRNVVTSFGGIGSEAGVAAEGEDHHVTRNTLSGGRGLLLLGSGHIVSRNKILDVVGDGITGLADSAQIVKNKILDCGSDGIDIEASTVLVDGNQVRGAGADGIEIDDQAVACLVRRNKVSDTDDDGFNVKSGGHSFVRNSAKDSGGSDLESTVAETLNTYIQNKFATREFP